ncbi:CBS domain-containing protein CBSX5 [Dendrobium catenatum]|uniref:CBS domain-containing protein CBSX5 n=1 Tax=Dendrobium catenatum TaxID=906689 RepID=A0A2I0XFG1_9ASPA|nr:CBS domain-containing protein CBSX5 [Dendrobium catenatum]PKU86656.1 CBS domain-containing protein CBSX5 [Dendrobium catenatum]
MAVKFMSYEVSDLCIGKPALRALPISSTVGEALLALKQCGDTYVSVWTSERSAPVKKAFAGKLCMVDILCYLCAEENISSPVAALKNPISALLSKGMAALMRRVESHSRVLDALNLLLEGAHILWVPIRSVAGRKKLGGSSGEFCWLTQEDFVRFFFNSIAIFSPIAALSVTELGLVRSADVLSVHYHDAALSFLPLIRRALVDQTSVAVVTDDHKLIGEISPSTLAGCDESVAAAIAALSAGDLMAYIDWCASPPDAAVRTVKSILKEKGMQGMLELMEGELSPPMFSSSSSTYSASSSSDEEGEKLRRPRRARWMGSYSARMGRRSEEAIVCHPGSSLVAVMVQALAHRVGYVWVVEEDYSLVGIVVFRDILEVFREQLVQAEELV